VTARSDAQARLERIPVLVVEVDADACTNTYGSAPCTAAAGAGNECYYTYTTCQDKANFTRGSTTLKFCSRGALVPGENVAPYVVGNAAVAPTEIVPSKGLAMRSSTSITLVDEPGADHLQDRHYATRAAAAQGTFWARLLARNPTLVGRAARVRRGYAPQFGAAWDWATFQTETFVVEALRGPDAQGRVTLALSDVLKLADRNVVPASTSGKLQADLKAVENRNFVQSATSTTVGLHPDASAFDGAYVGFELYIEAGVGEGQRRTITAYVGASRQATVAAWGVTPEANSIYQVGALSLAVTGAGSQYADPATSGKAEYVRIGDEIIQYTSKSGDVLSWADTTYRAQWGTAASDHSADDAVQLCRAWVAKRPWEVLRDIYVESGIDSGYLDTATWQTEDATWLNTGEITAIIPDPTRASDLSAELLQHTNCVQWWDPVAAKVKLLANMPMMPGTVTELTDEQFLEDSTAAERLDAEIVTRALVAYGPRDYTGDMGKGTNYLAARGFVDTDAEGANELGAQRPEIVRSRWLGASSGIFAAALAARKVARLRNAPVRFTAKLDPRNEVTLGQLVTLTHPKLVDATGAPKATSMRVVRVADKGSHQEVALLTTGFKRTRYGFIAPNGQPDYTGASAAQRLYAYVATTATSKMSNGDDGYYIS